MTSQKIVTLLEPAVRQHFEKEGYFVARAKRGPVDLVAIRKSWLQGPKIATVLFIRCKPPNPSQREPFEQKEKTELIVLAAQYGAVPVWTERVGANVSYKWLGYELKNYACMRKVRA